jgi:hypothetical protein
MQWLNNNIKNKNFLIKKSLICTTIKFKDRKNDINLNVKSRRNNIGQ